MASGSISRTVFLLLAIGLGLASWPCRAEKRRFTVADDIELVHFGDIYTGKAEPFTFSPDGRYFVVDTERGLLKPNRPESTLRVFRTEDVRQFLLRSEPTHEPSPVWTFSMSTYKDGPIITNIRWLSDSNGIAFLTKTLAGNDQLFLGDLRSRSVRALTLNDQHVTAFAIRDVNHFVYSVESPAIREKAILESQAVSIVGTGMDLYHLQFPTDFFVMSKLSDLSELWAVLDGKRFRIGSESSSRLVFLHRDGQSSLALSPDGRYVVTAVTVSIVPPEWETLYLPSLPSDPYRIRSGRQDPEAPFGFQDVSEYVLIELSTGTVKPLTNAPIGENIGWWSGVLSADWSSDGKSVLLSNTFIRSSAESSNSLPIRPCVAVVDLTKDHATCVEPLRGKAKTKTGYEDGTHIIVSARFAPGSSARVAVDYWDMGHADKSTRDMVKRSAYYTRSDDGSWVAAETKNEWKEPDRAIEIDVKQSLNDPPVLVATDKTVKSRVILDPNPQLKDVELGEASVYKWKDRNDRAWVGGLYKPRDFMQGQRYPLVIQTHGFVESLFRPDGIFPTAFAARELAAAGILVLQVSDCPFTVDPEEGPCNVAGYEAAIQQLVREGLVDRHLVGIVGFSRSCYYVMDALTTSMETFKAASITDGLNYGYLQYITQGDIGKDTIPHEAEGVIGVPPFGEGLQQWFKRSPEFKMDKVTAPLQVVAMRPDVLLMWEPYAALRFLNKPVDLIVLAEGTHVLSNPAERMVSQGGTVDWFRFWLKGEEDSDPSKVEQYARWRQLRKLEEQGRKPSPQNISR